MLVVFAGIGSVKRIREFYLRWRLELAFLIVLYVWIRLSRYEFSKDADGLFVFDKCTTRVDKAILTRERFVEYPAHLIR